MRPKPDACRDCPAYQHGKGFVTHTGSLDTGLVFVGQGPGEQEADHSVPFYHEAPSGWRLASWLAEEGVSRHSVTMTNIVWCWLPQGYAGQGPRRHAWGNREPTKAEVQYCWDHHVGPFLHSIKDRITTLIPVGIPAAKWLLGLPWDKGAERYVGTPNWINLKPYGTRQQSGRQTNDTGDRSIEPGRPTGNPEGSPRV